MKTLIIDNHDSFTFNLYQLVAAFGGPTFVFRNDRIDLEGVHALDPDRIIISPGPGHPEDPTRLGVGRAIMLDPKRRAPVLGVCLGHQAMIQLHGGRVIRAAEPRHGRASSIFHDGAGLFAGLPSPLLGMRYHSLVVDPNHLPEGFERTAWTEDGVLMGVRNPHSKLEGIQFHPESIGTPEGRLMLQRFVFGGLESRMPQPARS